MSKTTIPWWCKFHCTQQGGTISEFFAVDAQDMQVYMKLVDHTDGTETHYKADISDDAHALENWNASMDKPPHGTLEKTTFEYESEDDMSKTKFGPILSEQEIRDLDNDHAGFCTICCDFTHDACEPDAYEYRCPNCNNRTVYGTHEALIRGFIHVG